VSPCDCTDLRCDIQQLKKTYELPKDYKVNNFVNSERKQTAGLTPYILEKNNYRSKMEPGNIFMNTNHDNRVTDYSRSTFLQLGPSSEASCSPGIQEFSRPESKVN
jgi:hypothetical protein